MKSSVVRALAALLLVFPAAVRAQAPAVETKTTEAAPKETASKGDSLIETLDGPELDEVLSLLRDHFIKPEMLGDLPLKRATVQGTIERLAPGVTILQASPADAAATGESPFRSEGVEGRFTYVRLGSATTANVTALDGVLAKLAGGKAASLVLDLRATPPSSDFEQMAEVCRRFVPKGKVLFSVHKPNVKQDQVLTSKDDPKFHGVLVVLIDRSNAGTAEVIAAVLRANVNAIVIGQQTRGEAVEFANFPLPSGKLVRIAVAEVALPDKASIFPGGVKPDVAVAVPAETTEAVLKQGLEKGVRDLIFETERPRMNEAALVSGANPELDAALAAQQNKGERPKAPLHDPVLQRAADFIATLAIYEKSRAK